MSHGDGYLEVLVLVLVRVRVLMGGVDALFILARRSSTDNGRRFALIE